jgi:hypothetical protein
MSAWKSIFILENISASLNIQIEKNEAIGLLAMYLGMKIDIFQNFNEFSKQILPLLNAVINDRNIQEICHDDRLIILHLAFLTHCSVIGNIRQRGTWPSTVKVFGVCKYPGCQAMAYHKDHIWPHSLGGPFEVWNFQGLCDFHNRMKSNSPVFNFSPDGNFQTGLKNWLKARQWI